MAQSDPAHIAQLVAQQLASLSETFAPVREAVEGYRASLEREGYPDALARKMAADYHGALIRLIAP